MPDLPIRDPVEVRRAVWCKDGMAEIDVWCEHVGRRVREVIELQAQGRYAAIEESEALFTILVVMNRLAHIASRSPKPRTSEWMAEWIEREVGWPKYVGVAFWACVRNPTMHLGRAWAFADHGRAIPGDPERLLFASVAGDWAHPGWEPFAPEDDPHIPYMANGDGWTSVAGMPPMMDEGLFAEGSVAVTFHMRGILHALSELRRSVLKGLSKASDEELRLLERVNQTTGFISGAAPAEPYLAALDLSDMIRRH